VTLGVLAVLAIAQAVLAARVVARWLRTAGGGRVRRCATPSAARVSVIVPVLDERHRLSPCLEGLIRQPDEVAEILVVDGGSTDGSRRPGAPDRR
jgi:dolichol-phosphate mannosyltransferase